MALKRRVALAQLVVALGGVALIVVAAAIAKSDFHYLRYNCGSVLFAKDPRNLGAKSRSVPPALSEAYRQCEDERSNRSRSAAGYLIAGSLVLLLVVAGPPLTRRLRRFRRRHRSRGSRYTGQTRGGTTGG